MLVHDNKDDDGRNRWIKLGLGRYTVIAWRGSNLTPIGVLLEEAFIYRDKLRDLWQGDNDNGESIRRVAGSTGISWYHYLGIIRPEEPEIVHMEQEYGWTAVKIDGVFFSIQHSNYVRSKNEEHKTKCFNTIWRSA